ncbi:unnamed protein product [Lymnaea stagnalis]|uniref:RNA exonuclease 4 n=1 Tax=Lymnaea stagnalis TaxID=6523 RepID=A0AAV2I9G6_LYMST
MLLSTETLYAAARNMKTDKLHCKGSSDFKQLSVLKKLTPTIEKNALLPINVKRAQALNKKDLKKAKTVDSNHFGTSEMKLDKAPLEFKEKNEYPDHTEDSSHDKKGFKTHKNKKGSKKKHDGASNWTRLCMKLHINSTTRKNKPENVKRMAEDDISPDSKRHACFPSRLKPDVWFDNVDNILIESDKSQIKKETMDPLVKPDSFKGLTNCVAMDCEMVGVGPKGEDSILARVSIVNHFGVCLYDKFVLPTEKVTDYRTHVSGVTPQNLSTAEEFSMVQKEVSDIIRGRILVGHALQNDLRVLFLTHPHKLIRDTSQYKPFRELFKGRLPSLKNLTEKVLGVSVQAGQHSSIQDSQAAMRLYTMFRQKWEKEIKKNKRLDRKKKKKVKPASKKGQK